MKVHPCRERHVPGYSLAVVLASPLCVAVVDVQDRSVASLCVDTVDTQDQSSRAMAPGAGENEARGECEATAPGADKSNTRAQLAPGAYDSDRRANGHKKTPCRNMGLFTIYIYSSIPRSSNIFLTCSSSISPLIT